jgi:hypothetical protein
VSVQPKKYNLAEIIDEKYLAVRTAQGFANPNAHTDALNTITQAFREAAEESAAWVPTRILFDIARLGVGLSVVGGGFGALTGLYHLPIDLVNATVAASGVVMWVTMGVGDIATDKNRVFGSQFKALEDGYTIDPDAEGDEKAFEKASGKLDKYIESKRANAVAQQSGPTPPTP